MALLSRTTTSLDDAYPLDMEAGRDADLLRCVESLIAGDYMVSPAGEDVLSRAVASLVEKLRKSSQAEMDCMVGLSIQVNETAIFSAHMLSNLRDVDARSEAIAAAAEELVSTVASIDSYATTISTDAQSAASAAQQGADCSSQAEQKMERISQSVQSSQDRVEALTKFSEQIGGISIEINKIANQTNLLALNATIEAARAGEAGKGFAVVAGEVKSLSEETRRATEEINTIVDQLRSEMSQVTQSIEESTAAVSDGREAIGEVGETMRAVHQRINEVSNNTQNISGTLSEQAVAAEEVAKGIVDVASSSGQSLGGIEQIVDAMGIVETLISEEIARFAAISLPNKVLKLAQSDHVIWKKRLADMVIGRCGLDPKELADHHTCRLGKWYDQVDDPQFLNNESFAKLVEPHKLVHTHGLKAVELFNAGNLAAALDEIAKVEDASKDVLSLLAELEADAAAA